MNVPVRVPSLLIVALLLSVPQPARAQEPDGPPAEPTAEAPAANDDRIIDMILVKVNSVPIFLSDLEGELANQLALFRTQFSEEDLQAQLPQLRRDVLVALIDDRMMMQRADQMGITADANSVDRAVQRIRAENNLTSDEEFQAALESMNMTVDELREQTRKRIRQQQLVMQEVQRSIFVSDSEISRYYEEHGDEFTASAQVRLEQLVFVGGQDLRVRAASALEELRAGEDLESVAARYPDATVFAADDTFVAVGDLQESLAAAVPELVEGAYSDPIRSQFGWHVVRLIERQEHRVRPLDEVKEAIRTRLTGQKYQERLEDYLGQLRDQTHLTILAAEFNDVEDAWKRSDEMPETE